MDTSMLEHYVEDFNTQHGRAYPCSNQIVVCAVITKDRDKALAVMKKKGAVIRKLSWYGVEWELHGEKWLWRIWNGSQRGYRFYKVLIDKEVEEDLLHYVIVYSALYCCYMEII